MENNSRDQGEETAEVSFGDILKEFESSSRAGRKDAVAPAAKGKGRNTPSGQPAHWGVVVGISGDFVLIDHGVKSEGVIPVADLLDGNGDLSVKVGDGFEVVRAWQWQSGNSHVSIANGLYLFKAVLIYECI